MSATGQFQTAIVFSTDSSLNNTSTTDLSNNYGMYISSDYGNSWNMCASVKDQNNNYVTNATWYAVAISANGKFQSAVVGNPTKTEYTGGAFKITYLNNYQNCGIYTSNDYGNNWTLVRDLSNNSPSLTCVAMSSSGQYQTALGGCLNTTNKSTGIYISSDYGATWSATAKMKTTGALFIISFNIDWSTVAVSSSGQYQTACAINLGIFYSNDYGNNWSGPVNSSDTGSTFYTESYLYGKITYNAFANSKYLYTFTSTSTNIDSSNRTFTAFSANQYITGNGINSDSKIITILNLTSFTFETSLQINSELLGSVDIGIYSINAINGNAWFQSAMSSSGEYQTLTILGNVAYNSVTPSSLKSIENLTTNRIDLNGPMTFLDDSTFITADTFPLDYTGSLLNQIVNTTNMYPSISSSSPPSYSCCTMTSNGQIQIVALSYPNAINVWDGTGYKSSFGIYYVSINYGATWSQSTFYYNNSLITYKPLAISISSSGKYITLVTYDVSGNSKTVTFYSNSVSIFTSASSIRLNNFPQSYQYSGSNEPTAKISMSGSGQYQTIAINNLNLFITSNSGSTWFSRNTIGTNAFLSNVVGVSVSFSGQFQCLVTTNATVAKSTDYGTTWKILTVATDMLGCIDVAISSTGQYQTILANTTTNSSEVYYSNSYGELWKKSTGTGFGSLQNIIMTSSGKYQIVSSISGLHLSIDFGSTWITKYTFPTASLMGAVGLTNSYQMNTNMALSYNGQFFLTGPANYKNTVYTALTTAINTSVVPFSSTTDAFDSGTIIGQFLTWDANYSKWRPSNTKSISIGSYAGYTVQGQSAVAIGSYAGYTAQGLNAVAIGLNAGNINQGQLSVAIGSSAGYSKQGDRAVAIGSYAGNESQRAYAVAIGVNAGQNTQGESAVAIGFTAGNISQGPYSVAIGFNAGQNTQGQRAVAIGGNAGQNTQGENSIAIGYNAGLKNDNKNNNVIILNASGSELNSANSSAFYVNPIRNADASANVLCYNSTDGEITYCSAKSFIIDHPLDENKYLVHACLEGPESGIYYRGKGEVVDNHSTKISLPNYVTSFATELTTYVTAIYDGKVKSYAVSDIDEEGSFNVYGENGKFNWVVFGKRGSINVEPLKSEINVKGFGPYKWVE